jgi:hypothetical protein
MPMAGSLAMARWDSPFDAAAGAYPGGCVPYYDRRKEAYAMVIKGQSDIEIHISDIGYICLKQLDGDGEHMISFAPAYAAKVAGAISQLQDFAQRKFEKSEIDEE